MEQKRDCVQGCMLGMAVGDAMGAGVDNKSLEDIRTDYGPDGLLGYDLVNGFAEISSYSQVAAYAMNGLLVAMTRGQLRMPFIPHISAALKEWARSQYFPRETQNRSCWLCHEPHMRRRRSMDPRTLDALTRRDATGTPEKPSNRSDGPGTLPAAVVAGLLFSPERMDAKDVGALGAQIVALTHGDPKAFLSGAVLAYGIAGIAQDREGALSAHFINAAEVVATQFSHIPEAALVSAEVKRVVALAEKAENITENMESLRCLTALQVLCGAVYASLVCEDDFDRAMIIAINHSGKSAAVGAVTGAVLGARLGKEALPEFYLESLDAGAVMEELAADFSSSTPGKLTRRLFDDDWDRKYAHGLPVDRHGWYTE